MRKFPIVSGPNEWRPHVGWKWTRLTDLARLESGHTPSRRIAEWWGGDVPWLALPDIRELDGKVALETKETTNGLGLANSSARLLPKDTIALSRTASVGFVTRFGKPMATSQDFANWICGENLDPGFLLHAFRCSREYLQSIASGAVHKTIYMPEIKDLRILHPSVEEQRRIAKQCDEQLKTVAIALESSSARAKVAVSLGKSQFRSAFRRLTPVTIGAPLEPPPSGWRWRRLTDLAQLESGHTPSRKRPDWWGGDIPWIALPDIRAMDGRVAMETLEKTNALGIANSSARILPVNTVVLSRTASVGFVTILGREMATSQDFVNWICGDNLDPRFLLHALRASRDYLVSNASGAVHKTLYMPAVKDFHLCLPDLAEQRRVAAALDEALAAQQILHEASRRELAAIEALPAAILRELFTDAA
jgi:type I restriction enzyme, S subunit